MRSDAARRRRSCSRRCRTRSSATSRCSGSSAARCGPTPRLQRHAGHRRAGRPALRDAGQGPRDRRRGARPATSAPSRSSRTPTPATRSARRTIRCSSPPIELPEPLLASRSRRRPRATRTSSSTGLARLQEEDPTLPRRPHDETHETVMYGMGEAHLEVMVERLKRKFGVEVVTTPAKIAYRETLRGKAKATGPPREAVGRARPVRRVRDRGRADAARRGVRVRGQDLRRRDPPQFIPSIEKGIVKTMAEGVRQRQPDGRHQGDARRREVPRGRLLRHGVPDRRLARAEGGGRPGRRRAARAGRAARGRRARVLHRRHHGRPELQARQDPGHGAGRRRQAGDPRAGAAGRDRPLRRSTCAR